jgi:spore coat polysaccharide biosynthesis predicted glycosyltransferase SpsG
MLEPWRIDTSADDTVKGPESLPWRWLVPTLLVRCEVGPSIGVGHAMRCLALSEEFLAHGWRVVFAAEVDAVPWVAERVTSRGVEIVPVPDDLPGLAHRLGAGWVLMDSYLLPPAAYDALREAGVKVLAMVDGAPAGRFADLYVDQNIGTEHDVWPLPAGSTRLAGLRYAITRDDLRVHRPAAPRAASAATPSVLAVFGGTDAFGAAPVLTRALLATGAPVDLTVVAGSADLRAELTALAPVAGGPQRVTVIDPTDRLAELVVGADLVISASGTSTWELFCLGAACALIWVVDNQEEAYHRVVASGAAAGLGALADVRDDAGPATAELRRLLADPAARERLAAAAWQAVDGRGRERVLAAVEAASAPA